jgi:hypothetical protein
VKATNVIITLQGLQSLNKLVMEETIHFNAPKAFDRLELDSFRATHEANEAQKAVYDPSKPLNLRFTVLNEYLKEYESK